MFKSLIVNASILISMLFITDIVVMNREKLTLNNRYFLGLMGGVLGMILMFFTVAIENTPIMLDFRHMALLIIIFSVGTLPSLITAAIIGVFRILYFGMSFAGAVALINIVLLFIGANIIRRIRMKSFSKWIVMNLFASLIHSVTFYLVLKRIHNYQFIILEYIFISLMLGVIVYFVLDYIKTTDALIYKLKEDAIKDFLTGLNNVRSFDISLNRIQVEAQAQKYNVSLITLDIDFFKNVNDNYGHLAGDAVLKQIANILQCMTRAKDIAARTGGEEFSIILPYCSHDAALLTAERIRKHVEHTSFILPEGIKIHLTVSLGVATFPQTENDFNKIIKQADECLYLSKKCGRNQVSSVFCNKGSEFMLFNNVTAN